MMETFIWKLAIISLLQVITGGQQLIDYANSVVATSKMKSLLTSRNSHVTVFPGTPYNLSLIRGNIDTMSFGLTEFSTHILSIEVAYDRKLLYMFDANVGAVYVINQFDWQNAFKAVSLGVVHSGLSRDRVRLAFDWVSNNIYWTDPLYGWIVVQNTLNSRFKIVIHKDQERPVAIAVDPLNSVLFWSDVGSTVTIQRSSLSGTNIQTIISTGLGYPISIAVDHFSNKIMWVDSVRDTLEMANFDGSERKVVMRLSRTELYDLAVNQDSVVATDYSSEILYIIDKNTGIVRSNIKLKDEDPFRAVAIYSPTMQQQKTSACASFGCSDLCFNEVSGPVCLCRDGFKLNAGGKTCSEVEGQFYRAVAWSNSSHVCLMDIRSLTTSDHLYSTECIVSGGSQISHFDFDMEERKVIYADGSDIYTTTIDTFLTRQRVVTAVGQITGLSIDWRNKNIYWSTAGSTGTIKLISRETSQSSKLLTVLYPKDLFLLPLNGTMLWISGTSGSYKIEKAELDGSNRATVVSSLANPKSVTADVQSNTIYFIDGIYIKRCDLNGGNLKVISYTSPQHTLIYKNYLVVADDDSPDKIKTSDKTNGSIIYQLIGVIVSSMTDMKILDEILQPDRQGPCDIFNGDCEQICIPIGRNNTCQCEYGYQLDSNRKTCSSAPMFDDFLVVTDWTHNAMYQVSLTSDDVRAVDTETYGSPLGIEYNYKNTTVIWNTENIIHKLNLQTKEYRILFNTGILGCVADRFAIDFTSGDVYFTCLQSNVDSGGFVGVGVFSSDGSYKRLISDGMRPRAIALDPEDGLLFWSDHGDEPFVKRANMDGTGVQYIKSSDLKWPNGIAVDTKAKYLYITDGNDNIIYRCSYSGTCVSYFTDTGAHLMDIKLLGDYLYYLAWNRPYVTKLHKINNNNVTRVAAKAELGRLDSLVVYSSKYYSGQTTTTSTATTTTTTTSTTTTTTTTPTTTTTTTPTTTTTRTTTTTTTTTPSTTTTTPTTTTPTTTTTTPTTTTTTTPTTTTTTPTTTTTTTPTTTTTTTPTTTVTTTPNTTTTTPTTTATIPTTTTTTPATTTTTTTTTVTTPTTTSTTSTKSSTPTTINTVRTTNDSLVSPTTTAKSTPSPAKQDQPEIPVVAIGGATAGFAVIVVVIVILLVILIKRSRRKAERQPDSLGGFDMANMYNSFDSDPLFDSPQYVRLDSQLDPNDPTYNRPDSTYDKIENLIDFGDGPYENLQKARTSTERSSGTGIVGVVSNDHQLLPLAETASLSSPLSDSSAVSRQVQPADDYLVPQVSARNVPNPSHEK